VELFNPHRQAFALGALVVPAHNGALKGLGYNVDELGLKALGLVIESKTQKSLVNFPELNITLWLSHDEMADVEKEAAKGKQEFAQLLPSEDSWQKEVPAIVFWLWKVCRMLPVSFVLNIESGDLIEVWDQEDQPIDFYYKGDLNVPCTYFGLGVTEFFPAQWKNVESFLGTRLLFSRFLPSGMHKLEIALYIGR
jgi:hypothetical protein